MVKVVHPQPILSTVSKPRRKALAVIGVVSVLLVAVIFGRNQSLDVTENQLYTLSDETLEFVAQIDSPVQMTLYVSDQLVANAPQYGSYADRVQALLERLRGVNPEHLQFERVRVEQFTEEEDAAIADGLSLLPINSGRDRVVFGVSFANSFADSFADSGSDRTEVVSFLQPEREPFLEYEVVKRLQSLSLTERPRIGVISELPLFGSPLAFQTGQTPEPLTVISELQASTDVTFIFEPKALSPAAEERVDGVVVATPAALTESLKYALDQYVLSGGRVLLFLDPKYEFAQDPGHTHSVMTHGHDDPTASDLTVPWGFRVDSRLVAADPLQALYVNVGTAEAPEAAIHPAWLRATDFAAELPWAQDIGAITVASAGIVSLVTLNENRQQEDAPSGDAPLSDSPSGDATSDQTQLPELQTASRNLSLTPIVSLSPEGGTIDAAALSDLIPDFESLYSSFAGSASAPIGAMVTGIFASGFPQGPPDAADLKDSGGNAIFPVHLNEAVRENTITVIGDSDILHDELWVETTNILGQRITTPVSGNGGLVLELVSQMVGSKTLSGLRSRGSSLRPFTVFEAIQSRSEQSYRAEEQALVSAIEDLQTQLDSQQDAEAASEEAVQSLTEELIAARSRLRAVKRELTVDLERIQFRLSLLTIGMPLVVFGLIWAGLVASRRWQNRKESHRLEQMTRVASTQS